MGLPSKLKNMNAFVDGVGYAGVALSVGLPKLARKTEAYRGAGMGAEVDLDMGLEKLETTVTFGSLMPAIQDGFGTPKIDGVMVRFNGAVQRDDTGEYQTVEIVMRGRWTEIDRGESKPGDKTEVKCKAALVYYKETIDGSVRTEIDIINMIEMIGGIDRMADMRKALNL